MAYNKRRYIGVDKAIALAKTPIRFVFARVSHKNDEYVDLIGFFDYQLDEIIREYGGKLSIELVFEIHRRYKDRFQLKALTDMIYEKVKEVRQ